MNPIIKRRISLILSALLLALSAVFFTSCGKAPEPKPIEDTSISDTAEEGETDTCAELTQENDETNSEEGDLPPAAGEAAQIGDKSPVGSTGEFKKKFGNTISQMAAELGVNSDLLAAVILVESGGSGFVDGNLKIRFENHYFLDRTEGYTDLFTYYWKDHKFRTSTGEEWKTVHTGRQSGEYAAFNFAKGLNEEAAYGSISMGLGQIIGANYAACGYGSAKEMFEDFSKGHLQQIKGMAVFFKNYNNGKTLRRCATAT